ncbi:MAG: hypothetical protein AAF585_09370 [Verrucomicrobiota bacterium]
MMNRVLQIVWIAVVLIIPAQQTGAWGGGHISMTEAAFAVQPADLKARFAAMHRNDFADKEATIAWYLTHRFCMHPDWVDGPTRNEEDIEERMRSTQFVYGERGGKFFPPIAYTDPDKDTKGPRPKTYHYFTLNTEELNRTFARKGAAWYFEKIGAAFREGRDVDAAEYLGAFAHAIEDRVSPYHVWDGYVDAREKLETQFAEHGLQSPEASWNGKPSAASLFWGLGGEGMSNDLPDGFQPTILGRTVDSAADEFVERLFESRAAAELVYANPEGFMKAHLADDWKNRKTSEETKLRMAEAAADNVKLVADVIFTSWMLAQE